MINDTSAWLLGLCLLLTQIHGLKENHSKPAEIKMSLFTVSGLVFVDINAAAGKHVLTAVNCQDLQASSQNQVIYLVH